MIGNDSKAESRATAALLNDLIPEIGDAAITCLILTVFRRFGAQIKCFRNKPLLYYPVRNKEMRGQAFPAQSALLHFEAGDKDEQAMPLLLTAACGSYFFVQFYY